MKKILLSVTGMTPQVVTETIYALFTQKKWTPDEVFVITTKSGAESARLNLLTKKDGRPGKFQQLIQDYRLKKIKFPVKNILVPKDADGNLLEDIRTPEQNACVADFIVNAVREIARDPDSELHVSIAGGRKTMGYFLGYALSLFGRKQDRLSHVLVDAPYENNPDFFYPTPESYPINPKGEKVMTVDAKLAKVDLAEIPFVRLSEGLPKRLMEEPASFTNVVDIANRDLSLKIEVRAGRDRKVFFHGEPLKLPAKEFFGLLWYAEKAKRGEKVDLNDSAAVLHDYFDKFPKRLASQGIIDEFKMEEVCALPDAMENKKDKTMEIWIKEHFEPMKSRLRNKLRKILSAQLAERYLCQGSDQFLNLAPSQIEIEYFPKR
jgi:CRISPR-associated protein (TIGR02584 family)